MKETETHTYNRSDVGKSHFNFQTKKLFHNSLIVTCFDSDTKSISGAEGRRTLSVL